MDGAGIFDVCHTGKMCWGAKGGRNYRLQQRHQLLTEPRTRGLGAVVGGGVSSRDRKGVECR